MTSLAHLILCFTLSLFHSLLVDSVCEVCEEFCKDQLSFYDGVVSLSLSCAYHLAQGETQRMPVMDYTSSASSSAGSSSSSSVDERQLRLQLRRKCYNCILKMLNGLIFSEIENSNDVLSKCCTLYKTS